MFQTYLPLRWSGHYPLDDFGVIELYEVEFYNNFGPWKKCEKVKRLVVDFCSGWIKELDENDNLIRSCQFTAVVDRFTTAKGIKS